MEASVHQKAPENLSLCLEASSSMLTAEGPAERMRFSYVLHHVTNQFCELCYHRSIGPLSLLHQAMEDPFCLKFAPARSLLGQPACFEDLTPLHHQSLLQVCLYLHLIQ